MYIVADGLGGYDCGEVASKIASDSVMNYFLKEYGKSENHDIKEVLKQSLIYANKKIYSLQKSNEQYKNMATTIVIACVDKNIVYYTSIGDSRMYSINSDFTKISQVTEDDTYVNALIKTNIINEQEALNHPQKHMLTKAVGIFNKVDVKVHVLSENFTGYILICTDGVTNMLNEVDILNIFKKNKFENVANKIVEKANDRGGIDNITAVAIEL